MLSIGARLNNLRLPLQLKLQYNGYIRLFNQSRLLKDWNMRYLPHHEWIATDKSLSKLGLAKSGAEQMGELVYIDFPNEVDEVVKEGDDLVILESVKASDSIAAPFDCKIVKNNEDHDLDQINNNPECKDLSWIVQVEALNPSEP